MAGEGEKIQRLLYSLTCALAAWSCVATGADADDAWRSRVAQPLLAAYDAAIQTTPAPPSASAAAATLFAPRFDADGRLQVDVHFDCAIDAPLAALRAAGLSPGSSVKAGPLCVVEGWLAPTQLAQVAAVAGALRVQVPSYVLARHPASPSVGQVARAQAQQRSSSASGIDSAGVSITRAGQFVSQTGTNGAGAMVGVQSTGVASLALIQGRGELPGVQVLNPSGGSSADSTLDEGTMLLEEVHAIAPGASLAFCGPQTFIDYASCAAQLISAGATILVDDMTFGPQDLMSTGGSYTQAISSILAQNPNVAMFTVSGNANGSYWEGSYSPVPVATAGLPSLSCTAGGATQVDNYVTSFNGPYSNTLTDDDESDYPLVLAWGDPYGQNLSNFDLYLFNGSQQLGCFSAAGSSDTLISVSLYESYTLYVGTPDSSLAGKFLKLWAGGDGLTSLSPATNGGLISPQTFASGIITIGAVDGADGVGNSIESFSSQGPLSLVFPTPQQLQAPILVAPDGINVDAAGTAFEGYLFPDGNFYGTSAAVPNAGGVAALLRGAFPSLTLAQLESALQSGAAVLGSGTPNDTFGYGRVDALGALATILPLPTMSALPSSTIVGGSSSAPLAFTASALGSVHFSVASTSNALIPPALVASGGAGVSIAPSGCGTTTLSCTLIVTPAIGQIGTATVTVSALDGANRAAPAAMVVTVTEPAAPALSVNSSASQEFTAGTGVAAPVAFAITGTGPLTVSAASSNAALVPASDLVLSAGCGHGVNTCSLAISTAAGASGSATITLTVTDSYGQSASGAASLQVDPGANSNTGASASGSTSTASHGGGGALRWWELIGIAMLACRVASRRVREGRLAKPLTRTLERAPLLL